MEDNFFNQFRSAANRLENTPSSKAWEKLEQRLGATEKPIAKRRFLRQWGIAASLLLALGAISILSTFLMRNNEQYALAESTTILEADDLVLTDAPTYDIYSLNSGYKSATVEEGSATKRLTAGIKYFYNEIPKSQQPQRTTSLTVISEEAAHLPERDFNWLLGEWKGSLENGTSLEEWQKVDGVFYGKGSLVVEGNTVFTERMKVAKKGDDWFYVLQLDPYSEALVYQLQQYDETEMIFTNEQQDFPAQVVLRRNDDGSFSTQLLARDYISLSPTQLSFLTKRNVLLVNKAVRNLVKK